MHADYFDFRAHLLDKRGHARGQATTADGHKHGINRAGVLADDFQRHRALAGNHIGVVKRRNIGEAAFFYQLHGMIISIVIRHAFEHHFAAEIFHRIDFDLRRGFGHHNGGATAELARRQSHALGMVARAGSNHAFFKRLLRQLGHFVVGTADFKGKHRLQIFALEQHMVAGALRKAAGGVERGFNGHIVNRCGENAGEIVCVGLGIHGVFKKMPQVKQR